MTNNIKNERKQLGLTQKELANEFNQYLAENRPKANPVSYAAISRWENGENDPNSDTWFSLASFFKVSVTYLQGYSSERVTDEMTIMNELDEITFSEDANINESIHEGLGNIFLALIDKVEYLERQLDEHKNPEKYEDYD
ncbi:helix-turn-helix domain-containing protein [Lentilactobacillus sp. SPB1-3]|uniref:Helix-turn-helix domain-containing protein n=1 Tax=Lentilactobacillus terminaliae TaxID=3003483 RepID=A0ACD5DDA3_9LACO|nr:helix-turn-helix transcriptional regulator [Lentilactobacillus sp. SPB1-3]MCZ0978071.1 helix-turn-helix transcriptional regulator [Lentilactobacillus sp. SPB1-3]